MNVLIVIFSICKIVGIIWHKSITSFFILILTINLASWKFRALYEVGSKFLLENLYLRIQAVFAVAY